MSTFTEEQEAEIQKRIDDKVKLVALTENALTFMELSLNRSKQSGDRVEVYNAGVAVFNMLQRPAIPSDKKPEDDVSPQ